jgi:nucleoside phosphorylase
MLEGDVRTLVTAAYPPEIDGLVELLPQAMARGLVVSRAVGIGLVEASAGAERAIAEVRPERVVLVGTAGMLPGSELHIGQVVIAKRAHLVVREPEYLPVAMHTQVDADHDLASLFGALLEAPLVKVACPVGVTSTDAEAERLALDRSQVEQLECFAVLAAAARAGLPATSVLAIANRVGASGAAEWQAHRARAEAAALSSLAKVLLAAGAG